MLKSKKGVSNVLWQAVELMIAAIVLLLIISIGAMLYTTFISGPGDLAKAENAYKALEININELMASRKPFVSTTTDIEIPEDYLIVFFFKDKMVDVCGDKSIAYANCKPPCMCLYKMEDAEDHFSGNNRPDHIKCSALPKRINSILTWYHEDMAKWYTTAERIFPLMGSKVVIPNYVTYPPQLYYSTAFLYGECGDMEFDNRKIYLDKADVEIENKTETFIFLTELVTGPTENREKGFFTFYKSTYPQYFK